MKELLFAVIILFTVSAEAQTYLISFTGTGASSSINSVKVENLTKGSSLILNGNDILRLTGTTGINLIESGSMSGLKIYPNPMTDNSILQIYPPEVGNATLSVYDMAGKQVAQIQSYLGNQMQEFRLSGLGQGFYIISIEGSSYKVTGKLLSNAKYTGTCRIEKIGLAQVADYKKTESDKKGIESTVDMSYSTGDRLKFTGISGIYSTVIIDIPTSNKTINFIFFACTDGDNINYSTIKIGTQVWMAENLKTTKYRNGNLIGTTSPATLDISGESTPKYQWAYDGNEINAATYGRLYTWYAITDSRNVCPTGWHVPTDDELITLTNYLTNNGYGYGGSGNDIAKSMATTSGWNTDPTAGNVGNDQTSNNSSGFTVHASGYRAFDGTFISLGSGGFWRSSTEASAQNAFNNAIRSYDNFVYNYYNNKIDGFSVRCLRDF